MLFLWYTIKLWCKHHYFCLQKPDKAGVSCESNVISATKCTPNKNVELSTDLRKAKSSMKKFKVLQVNHIHICIMLNLYHNLLASPEAC